MFDLVTTFHAQKLALYNDFLSSVPDQKMKNPYTQQDDTGRFALPQENMKTKQINGGYIPYLTSTAALG
eukprot:JP441493.1.p2 GENE.JP441493.1~~JP441493.1.p2  ORF type:complete len:69 (-),score=20.94 JP441493.1:67-273(-)